MSALTSLFETYLENETSDFVNELVGLIKSAQLDVNGIPSSYTPDVRQTFIDEKQKDEKLKLIEKQNIRKVSH